MSETMKPTTTASHTYSQLHNTARAFIEAQDQDTSHPQLMDFEAIRSHVTDDFQHTWGHNYATSMNPRLQGTHYFPHFIKHLEAMLPNFKSWQTSITDMVVDDVKKKVMMRVSFIMVPKDAEEGVENDLLWVLEMTDTEGEWKVRKSTEFIDVAAAGKLKEIMMNGKA